MVRPWVSMNETRCGTYTIDDDDGELLQCSMCNRGYLRTAHCTKTKPTSCEECPSNTFNSGCSRATVCSHCKLYCDANYNLIVVKECTLVSDIQCGCKPGCWRPSNSDDHEPCIQHKSCGKGQRAQKGSSSTDTVCTLCKNGTFSNKVQNYDQRCTPWTRCDDFQTSIPGNITTDALCFSRNSTAATESSSGVSGQTVIIVSVVGPLAFILLIIGLILLVRHCYQRAKKKEEIPCLPDDLDTNEQSSSLVWNDENERKNCVRMVNGANANGNVSLPTLTVENETSNDSQPPDIDKTGDVFKDAANYISDKVIGGEWRTFGRKLGSTDAQLDQIEEKYPKDLRQKVYRIVMDWHQKSPDESLTELLRPLRELNKTKYADFIQQQLS